MREVEEFFTYFVVTYNDQAPFAAAKGVTYIEFDTIATAVTLKLGGGGGGNIKICA